MEGSAEMWTSEPFSGRTGTGQGLKTSASPLFNNVDQLQPLAQVGSRDDFSENYRPLDGTTSEYKELPPFSTFLKQPQLPQPPHTSVKLQGSERSRNWTWSETVAFDSQLGDAGNAEGLLQVTEGQGFLQPFTSRDQQSQDPTPPTQTSAKPGGSEGTVTSSTNQLTEEDQFLLEFCQDKRGFIKRPMNAFMVWSKIQRRALMEHNPGASFADISIHLGHEWSKLTEEERSPFFEIARKLKQIHQQKFPDYEYHTLRKKGKKLFPSRWRRQQSTTIPASRPIPQQFEGPSMNIWPMMPYTPGYYFHPSFCPCIPVNPYSSGMSARVFNDFPHTCRTMMEEAHYSHPQVFESNMASLYYNQQQSNRSNV